jgi:prevent-host-death family protein
MHTFTIHQAKTNLSKLIKLVEAGEEVVISRGEKPVVRLSPAAEPVRKSRGSGAWKGLVKDLPDFLEPMSEEELSLWEDGPIDPAS